VQSKKSLEYGLGEGEDDGQEDDMEKVIVKHLPLLVILVPYHSSKWQEAQGRLGPNYNPLLSTVVDCKL